jgi:hypothetical protein
MLFQVTGRELRPAAVFDSEGLDPFLRSRADEHGYSRCTPTGVLLHPSYLVVRHHGGSPEGRHVIVLNPLPADLRSRGSLETQHLTHSRLIAIRESVITEAGGHRGVHRLQPDGSYARLAAPDGLAVRSLRDPTAPPAVTPVAECPRVTAIAALPGNESFVTGGNRGEMDEWAWDGNWRQRRIRAPQSLEPGSPPQAIVGIVVLARPHRLVAVSAGGDVLIQRLGGEWEREALPERGSPRSLAAHPHAPWVAVGLKRGGFGDPESAVVVLEVSS